LDHGAKVRFGLSHEAGEDAAGIEFQERHAEDFRCGFRSEGFAGARDADDEE
jgi:hypothetical protein